MHAPPSRTAERWAAVLDEYEEVLVRQRDLLRAVAAGRDAEPVPTFTPPALLGDLPPELRERAIALLVETDRLGAHAVTLHRTGAPLLVAAGPRRVSSAPTVLDTTA